MQPYDTELSRLLAADRTEALRSAYGAPHPGLRARLARTLVAAGARLDPASATLQAPAAPPCGEPQAA